MIMVSEEPIVDFDLTARAATEAFASEDVVFSPKRIKWLYERGFSQGTTVIAAYNASEKIGQIALIRQTMYLNGQSCLAGQLVDLWVLKAYRSTQLIRRIYKEAECLCSAEGIRTVIAMPNENSKLLNERFFKLKTALLLQVRAGIGIWAPHRPSKLKYSGLVSALTKTAAVELFSGFATATADVGLRWHGESLFERTSDPTRDYAAHVTNELLLISTSRKSQGVSYTLLCGFFARPGAAIMPGTVRELVGRFLGSNRMLAGTEVVKCPCEMRAWSLSTKVLL
jgi:Acetyltransferase (GNAT) domain